MQYDSLSYLSKEKYSKDYKNNSAISYVILNVVLKFKYSTKGVFTAPAYIQTGMRSKS